MKTFRRPLNFEVKVTWFFFAYMWVTNRPANVEGALHIHLVALTLVVLL